MLTNCQRDSAPVLTQFAIKNLDYNKLKASTQTLHVTNGKAISQTMYKLCISKNCEIY